MLLWPFHKFMKNNLIFPIQYITSNLTQLLALLWIHTQYHTHLLSLQSSGIHELYHPLRRWRKNKDDWPRGSSSSALPGLPASQSKHTQSHSSQEARRESLSLVRALAAQSVPGGPAKNNLSLMNVPQRASVPRRAVYTGKRARHCSFGKAVGGDGHRSVERERRRGHTLYFRPERLSLHMESHWADRSEAAKYRVARGGLPRPVTNPCSSRQLTAWNPPFAVSLSVPLMCGLSRVAAASAAADLQWCKPVSLYI